MAVTFHRQEEHVKQASNAQVAVVFARAWSQSS